MNHRAASKRRSWFDLIPAVALLVVQVFFVSCGAGDGGASGTDVADPARWLDGWSVVGDSSSDGSASPGADGGAGPDTDDPCSCAANSHCDEHGECVEDVCVKGQTTCDSPTALQICNEDGSAFDIEPCPEALVCWLGECIATVCDPDEPPVCDGGQLIKCNAYGTDWISIPCPGGTACMDGECVTLQPNVILLIDTSLSMNAVVEKDVYPWACSGAGCPPWDFPSCDDPADPKTRLGRVKKALEILVTSDTAEPLRIALQRFPQAGDKSADCDDGYYANKTKMTDDNDAHIAPVGGWFHENLGQIMAVPFNEQGETDAGQILAWSDFAEEVQSTGQGCVNSWDCESGICVSDVCHEHSNPELRGMGLTPLGKSLFYAGEYLRHFVLVEGRPCTADTDCASPHHACVEGHCRDPFASCRPNIIIVFTDGGESLNWELTDFFHPRVQAKRLCYGLGCTTNDDCLSGSTCEGGVCKPPPGEVDEGGKACTVYDFECSSDADCPEFSCGFATTCDGKCMPAAVSVTDGHGSDHLVDHEGNPVSATVHVVDASGEEGANRLIAAYGCGQHVSVDLADLDGLVAQVLPLFDSKNTGPPCLD